MDPIRITDPALGVGRGHPLPNLVTVDDEAASAARTKNARKMSSMPRRDETNVTPSTISRMPAIAPMSVERVIRRTIRMISSTIKVPTSADENRQPQPL